MNDKTVNTSTVIIPSSVIPTFHPVFAERLRHRQSSPYQSIWALLDLVFDPELPGVTIWDLGILQDVIELESGLESGIASRLESAWEIVITPTYSGCPAVDTIRQDISQCLQQAGYLTPQVKVALAPAWSTDMISPAGKKQLLANTIAPPQTDGLINCPLCQSEQTEVISQFGSTACKALYRCETCDEVFDYFKTF